MSAALIHDAAGLEALKDTLDALVVCVDDEDIVPERYRSSVFSHLAEADQEALTTAARVVFRLGLWARYPTVHTDTYVAPRDDSHVARIDAYSRKA